MQERRQFVRVKTPVLVEFPHPQTMKTQRSFTFDVSETGLRFPTPVKLQVGQELPLSFQLPYQAGTTLHATGTVAWIREVARHGEPQYEIGLRFRWMEDPDQHQLTRYLHSVLTGNV